MKKTLFCIMICILNFSFGSVLANDSVITDTLPAEVTGENYMNNAELGTYGIYDEDNTIYLDDYSQYTDILNDMDYQNDYKQVYEENVRQEVQDYNTTDRTKVYHAKVVEAGEPETTYVPYSYYGQVYKTSYQPLSIKILEGPYKDKEFSNFNYILTCDTYGNITLPPAKKGDTINVVITQDEEGNLLANASSYDAPLVRWQWAVVLLGITLLLIVIYAGKKGLKSLIILVLLADLILIVAAPAIINGINIAFLVSVIVLLTSLSIAVLKLGVKQNAFVAILSTLIVTLIMTIVIYGFDAVTNLCGITYESTYLMEYIMPKVTSSGEIINAVDFHGFSIAITVLILFLGTILVACETVKIYQKNRNSRTVFQDTIDGMKEYLADKITLIAGILIVLIIPKYILLVVNKCALVEIVNSEIMITDLSRILFTIIALSIVVPVTTLLGKFVDDE